MNVLFISTSTTSDDRRAWSGTVYQAFQGLVRAGFSVDYLSAMQDYKQNFLDKVICTYWLRVPAIFGKLTRMDEAFYTMRIFRQTLAKIDYTPYDVIFVPTHISIMNAIPQKVRAKIVHLVDATVDSLFGYYNEFSNLWFHNYWEAHILGKQAFRKADLIIASSDWCRQNAIQQYRISPKKIKVIEFGANIDDMDIPMIERNYETTGLLNVYWSGVNWERKGGDVAYEACVELRRRGINVQLHITGMRYLSEKISSHPWVHNHGFLDKNNPTEYQRLIEVMKMQHIFLFPSRAECSSIALCEANAFALPCFVYDTGGTANYVKNDYNGFMLPLSANGVEFADKIILMRDKLPRLSFNARKMYEEKLNWRVWSENVKQAIIAL